MASFAGIVLFTLLAHLGQQLLASFAGIVLSIFLARLGLQLWASFASIVLSAFLARLGLQPLASFAGIVLSTFLAYVMSFLGQYRGVFGPRNDLKLYTCLGHSWGNIGGLRPQG